MRAVCEAVGIKDVLGKSLGSNNHANVVKATLKALSLLRNHDEVMSLRGKKKVKATVIPACLPYSIYTCLYSVLQRSRFYTVLRCRWGFGLKDSIFRSPFRMRSLDAHS